MERDEALSVLREVAVEVLERRARHRDRGRPLQGGPRRRQPRPRRAGDGARGALRHLGARRGSRGRRDRRTGRRPRADEGRRREHERPCALDHRGRPRVVVTGVGVKTPAGSDVDVVLGATLLAGRARRAHRSRASTLPASRHVRRRGTRLRSGRVLRAEGGPPRRTGSRSSASAPPPTRSADAGRAGRRPEPLRRDRRHRHRRAAHARGEPAHCTSRRARRGSARSSSR